MHVFDKAWKTVGIFLAVVMAGTMLLILAYMIPVNEDNKVASYDITTKEGWYPMVPILSGSYETYFQSFKPGVIDTSIDGLMIKNSLEAEGEGDNVLIKAMDMGGYPRYWHGYVSVLRPLLAVFDYGEIRTGNSILQLLIMSLLFSFLYQKKGIKYALLILTSYCFLMPLAMPFSLLFSWVFYITYIFLLYLASRKEESMPDGMKLYWTFMVVGMITNYLDFLTYPLYTWGIPMIWWLLLQTKYQKSKDYLKKVIYTGVWWLIGYAGMWMSKWCLSSIVLKSNIFVDAMNTGAKWTDSESGLGISNRLAAMYINWKHYEYKLYVILLLIWLLFVIVSCIKNGVKNNTKNKAILLVGASSAVWYFVMSKHTIGHHFFTHRTWGISILAVIGILLISTEKYLKQEKKERIKNILLWTGCGVLAMGLSLLPKEDVYVINGYHEFREVQVKEGESCEMDFIPSFPTIDQFTLCAKTDSHNGICRIRIKDGEKDLYEEHIELEEYQDITSATIPVFWKLERSKKYTMQIQFEDADSDTYVLVTINSNMPMSEYEEVYVNGTSENGQILSALNYKYRALSKFTLASLWIAWAGLLFAGVVAFFGQCQIEDNK